MRLIYFKPVTALLASAGVLGGCGTVPKDAGFADVHRIVLDRTGQRVQWNRQSNDDASATTAVRELLGQSLDADRAVQIALLNNRRLQATYEDLGVAQADVVQAGLLRNPVFDADLKFGTRGEGTTLEMAVVADFLDVFLIPLRRRVAEGQFESAKLRVTAAAIDLASRTRAAFYTHVADAQTLEMRRTVTDAAAAAFDFAKRLHTAGNVSDLAFATERAAYEQAKVDFARAEAMALDSRERFGELLGVWGPDTQWTALPRLPELPAEEISTADAERRAIEKSLDLAVEKQGVTAAAQTLGIRRSFGLFPELELGAAAERESDGGWGVGPAVSLPIPLLDQGQAATATAVA
ncbi:MAG TPA: TolC family protein, partial [Tepidisphaeraceae bacterium]